MAQNTLNFTTDGNVKIADIRRRHDAQSYAASFFMKGGNGGGTWTLQISPDGGTTKYTVKDVSGNNITGTTAAYFNFVMGSPNKNDGDLELYVNLTGSTSPTLTAIIFDNR